MAMVFGSFGYWWLVVLFFMLVAPIGYGWGYRGWGPPYPSYFQRRSDLRTSSNGDQRIDHYAWGWGGDLFWLVSLFWIAWAVTAFWSR
jgi:hypothetical protein